MGRSREFDILLRMLEELKTTVRDDRNKKKSGTATIANGATTVVVTHGLARTPDHVWVTPKENPTNAVTFWWADTIGATQFTINVNANPGASGLDFDWRAIVGDL